ncbi:hypothetical protein CPB86DRAFT_821424 [Serendipita vermifera]|nr:hypothetical protein CPB86DRAFT_821424 [Serendipita vermifera]
MVFSGGNPIGPTIRKSLYNNENGYTKINVRRGSYQGETKEWIGTGGVSPVCRKEQGRGGMCRKEESPEKDGITPQRVGTKTGDAIVRSNRILQPSRLEIGRVFDAVDKKNRSSFEAEEHRQNKKSQGARLVGIFGLGGWGDGLSSYHPTILHQPPHARPGQHPNELAPTDSSGELASAGLAGNPGSALATGTGAAKTTRAVATKTGVLQVDWVWVWVWAVGVDLWWPLPTVLEWRGTVKGVEGGSAVADGESKRTS